MKVTINGVSREIDITDPSSFSWEQHYVKSCQNPNMMKGWLRDISHGKWKDVVKVQGCIDAALSMGLTDEVEEILQQ